MIRRAEPLLAAEHTDLYTRVVRQAFSQRRKMMRKLLKARWPEPALEAAYAAAGLAKTDPGKAGWTAFYYGILAYIIPYMFVYTPVLLWQGHWAAIAQATATGCVGVWLLGASTEGWFGGKLPGPLRVLLFGAALALIHPGTETDLIGLGIAVPIYLWQRLRARRT